jgi:predicted nuclease with RNAse H fold
VKERWAGVDVGGNRKGFHLAVVDHRRLVAGPTHAASPAAAVTWLSEHRPALVAVDSPISPAPDGRTHRACERQLRREVCGIRWTPDTRSLEANPGYYGWILHGFELYQVLRAHGLQVIECFPTASWTRWAGARGGQARSRWTRTALPSLGLSGMPARTNQDERDAIAAAVTARAHALGRTQRYGAIVVPSRFEAD